MDSPKIKIIRNQVMNLLAMLNESDDEQLILDSLEGETDLFELVQVLTDGMENDEGMIHALDDQIAERRDRIARIEKRIIERKALILSLLETAGITKIPLPNATVFSSFRKGTPKVVDEEALTEEFTRKVVQVKPDMAKIKSAVEAGIEVPGVTITNGQVILNVRRN